MRIAFLADASLVHTVRWVNEFVGRGHECLLLSLERGDGYHCPVRWLDAPAGLPSFVRYTTQVRKTRALLADFEPDLVNAHFLPNYGWMGVLAGFRPLVLTTLGSDLLVVPFKTPLHRWRTRYVLERCDGVISDAEHLSQAIRRFSVSDEKILTVPMGIEEGRFAKPNQPVTPPCVVLSTRRLESIYDVGTFVRAIGLLSPEERSGMEFRIAGTGQEDAALQAAASNLPVHFLGWLPSGRLDEELSKAHVYVSTSRSDSTSVSLLEAMMAGCLPVLSDLPANREWVQEDETGLFFACGDAARLATCLRRAMADSELRTRAAARNRQVVTERASWTSNMGQVESYFARFAESAPHASGG